MLLKRLSISMMIIGALMMLQACGRQLPEQESCGFVQNSQSRRISWKDQDLIRLYIHQSVPQTYHEEVRSAVQRWNTALGRELLRVEAANVGGPSTPKKDGFSMIYFLEDWEPEKPTEQARTTVYWSGSRIYEADIRINDKNFDFFIGQMVESDAVHFESLLLHELGHALGLGHVETGNTVMKPFLSNGELRQEVGDLDLSAIHCEYRS